MRVLPFLISLIFPGCGGVGAEGVPAPTRIDFSGLQLPKTPNTALAAPVGFRPEPDILTRRYTVTADRLYEAIQQVAAAQPRTFPQIRYDQERQVHYVVRSALWNFPDLVAVQVNADSTVVIWSRSIYGRSDLGVNKARLGVWLAELNRILAAND